MKFDFVFDFQRLFKDKVHKPWQTERCPLQPGGQKEQYWEFIELRHCHHTNLEGGKDLADTEHVACPLKINRRSETSARPLQTGNKKMMKGKEDSTMDPGPPETKQVSILMSLLNAFG